MSDRKTASEKAFARMEDAEKAGLNTPRGQALVAAAHAYAALASMPSWPSSVTVNVAATPKSSSETAREIADSVRTRLS